MYMHVCMCAFPSSVGSTTQKFLSISPQIHHKSPFWGWIAFLIRQQL